ncbi:MAG: hypothetical protein IT350_02725 [Deltaproteobacteria bacterium]|nr:hypothetical protein [Deltaproteobacteria bacterium]
MTVGPLDYDPAWLERIRPMREPDVPRVAAMHAEGMGRTIWGRLGTGFLSEIYAGMIARRDFIGFVYEDGEGAARTVRGFIAGSENPRRMMRDIARARGGRLAFAALGGLIRRPTLLAQVASTPFYFSRSRVDDDVAAESLFCCFDPDLRGTRVSGLINKVLFDELAHRGHARVKITTETDNEGANRQLASWGFESRGEFRFYGKTMRVWVLDLAASPRVESVRRW